MNNNIIERILADAEASANERISTATEQSYKLLADSKEKLEGDYNKLVERTKVECQAIVDNQLANAHLDLRKYKLQCKNDLMDKVFADVLARLQALPRKEYLAFVGQLLAKHAVAGEVVFTNANDAGDIDQKFLDSYCQGLTLNKNAVDISGGVILSTENYDKVLTLEAVVKLARENDNGVATTLFGE